MLDSEVEGITTIPEATALCEKFAAALGYPYFAFGLRLQHGPAKARRAVLTNYPKDWLRAYEQIGYAQLDPISERMRTTMQPFVWDEIDRGNKTIASIFEAAAAYGLAGGFTVPIHYPGQDYVMLSLTGAPVPPVGIGRTMQFMQAWYFANLLSVRVTAIIRCSDQTVSLEPLTERERRILVLIGQGFSLAKAAEQLSVSRRTVDSDLQAAIEKLGVASREQALVRALACGEIEMLAFPEEVDISYSEGAPFVSPRDKIAAS